MDAYTYIRKTDFKSQTVSRDKISRDIIIKR